MKRILALLLMITMTLSLVGCTKPNTDLYNALEKMEGVTSVITDTKLDIQLSGQGFEGSKQMEIQELLGAINGLKIHLIQKSNGNKEQTKVQSQGELGIEFGGMTIATKIWADVDLDKSEFKSIIQLPLMLKGLLAPMGFNKEYIIYDIGEMMKEEDENLDIQEIIDLQKEFQPKIIELTKEIQKNLKPGFKIVDFKEEKEIDGEKVKLYQLKLDDETLKELIKELTHNLLENDGTKEFIVDYMNQYMDTMLNVGLDKELSKEEIEEIKGEIKEVEENLEENLKEIKEELDKFMEEIKDIKFLGEKGISIEYAINKDGYVAETSGTIDLELNLEEIGKIMGEESPEAKGLIKLTVNYTTKNTKINSKDIKIEFPETNEKNSVDLFEMINQQTQMQMLMP